jgi:hypothetical protein
MATAVDIICMTRQRPDTFNNREPVSPPAAPTKPDEGSQDETGEDERVVFSSWDGPLVPPLTRRD